MLKDFNGKTAVITGGSRGIGRAIALEFARRGASLVINYVRNEETAESTLAELKKEGAQAILCRANMKEPAEIDLLIETAVQTFGRIDVLIHNAALGNFKPVHQLKINQWELSLDINARAFLLLAQKTLPIMERQGSGTLLALSSLGARRVIPNYGAIGISKAALENLVRYLAFEFAPKNIRVNGISGGPIETESLKFFPDYESLKKEAIRSTPAGRMGRPEDLAKVVAFLASEDSRWIFGQTIIVDGGISLA
ncbi:MAG: SDR family oxidoreductase [Candidatus Omnitrophota bacterium]